MLYWLSAVLLQGCCLSLCLPCQPSFHAPAPLHHPPSNNQRSYGEQTLVLLRSLAARRGLDCVDYANRFEAYFGASFEGYRDVSTKVCVAGQCLVLGPWVCVAGDVGLGDHACKRLHPGWGAGQACGCAASRGEVLAGVVEAPLATTRQAPASSVRTLPSPVVLQGFLRNYGRGMVPPQTGAPDAQANCIARAAPLVAAWAGHEALLPNVQRATRVTQVRYGAV